MERFLISIPKELKETLKEEAETKGQTLCGLIRQILWEHVKEEE